MPERQYVPLLTWSCSKCCWQEDLEIPTGENAPWTFYDQVSRAHKAASVACHARWGVHHVMVHAESLKTLA